MNEHKCLIVVQRELHQWFRAECTQFALLPFVPVSGTVLDFHPMDKEFAFDDSYHGDEPPAALDRVEIENVFYNCAAQTFWCIGEVAIFDRGGVRVQTLEQVSNLIEAFHDHGWKIRPTEVWNKAEKKFELGQEQDLFQWLCRRCCENWRPPFTRSLAR